MEKIDWVNGKVPINRTNLNGMQDNIEKSCVAVSKEQPTTGENVWIKKGKNLFNRKNAISGYIGSNGAFVTGANNEVTSDYIEIESGKDYTLSIENWEGEQMWVGISLYDENKTFIERWDKYDASVTVPSTATQNAKYIRTSNRYNSNNIQIMLEQNSTATTYEDYIEKEIYVKNDNGVFERFYSESEMNKQNYSQTEQKIGTWIDGKTLYRKTIFKIAKITANTDLVINSETQNIDKIVKIDGVISSSNGVTYRQINTYNLENNITSCSMNAKIDGNIIIRSTEDWSSPNIIVTLEYTKTTD